jgi:hypothetical protein
MMYNLPELPMDQELTLLFQRYLPLQPMPATLTARLTERVMEEVKLYLPRQVSQISVPWQFSWLRWWR